ncbi:hypothetical protein [Neisseria sp. S1]|uniref:hypothetical protein n=1 Tax=Neisseria sp. S1 TaxID=3318354 RepID=UPI003A88CE74
MAYQNSRAGRSERVDFENWAHKRFDLARDGQYGQYVNQFTGLMWDAWQARADMPVRQDNARWVNCGERRPKPFEQVLFFAGSVVLCGFFDGGFWQTLDGYRYRAESVSFWQPMPGIPLGVLA